MTTAFLFPGQGATFPGMGLDLCAAWEEAREVYELAARITGRDLLALARAASREQLAATEAAHLLTFTHSLAVHRVLTAAGLHPDVVAGHSLGQWAALTAAGALSLDDGLRLIALRGRLLAECCQRRPGGMLAARGLDLPGVEAALAAVAAQGIVAVAAVNGDEVVVSAEASCLTAALRALKGAGAASSPLGTAGAFHSPLMAAAADVLAPCVAALPLRDPERPVLSTVSGAPLTSAAEIRAEIAGHVLAPVRWDRVLDRLVELGVDRWIEVGPGKALTGLVRRRSRSASAFFTSTAPALAGLSGLSALSSPAAAGRPS